jgi:hypothetical protein
MDEKDTESYVIIKNVSGEFIFGNQNLELGTLMEEGNGVYQSSY